jgi:hypothetical protein
VNICRTYSIKHIKIAATHSRKSLYTLIPPNVLVGTQFTCFTGTEVQILTQLGLQARMATHSQQMGVLATGAHLRYWYKNTCFTGAVQKCLLTGTKVQILN